MPGIFSDCSVIKCNQRFNFTCSVKTHPITGNSWTTSAHGHLCSQWLLGRSPWTSLICFKIGKEAGPHPIDSGISDSLPIYYCLAHICIILFPESGTRSPILYKANVESVDISAANASTIASLSESSWLFKTNGSIFWYRNSFEISPSKGCVVQVNTWRNSKR